MNVLIVEDQEVMRQLLRDFVLSAYPEFTILEAENGQQALSLCRSQAPRLVLMDVSLPDANGIDLTAEVKSMLPQTAVIIVSQYSAQPYIDQAQAAGAFAYVTKDKVYRELLLAIASALSYPETDHESGASQ